MNHCRSLFQDAVDSERSNDRTQVETSRQNALVEMRLQAVLESVEYTELSAKVQRCTYEEHYEPAPGNSTAFSVEEIIAPELKATPVAVTKLHS